MGVGGEGKSRSERSGSLVSCDWLWKSWQPRSGLAKTLSGSHVGAPETARNWQTGRPFEPLARLAEHCPNDVTGGLPTMDQPIWP